jgi:hypothetical protein
MEKLMLMSGLLEPIQGIDVLFEKKGYFGSFSRGLFEKKSKNAFFPKNEWYQQKVLLKSFPMNGHVSRFQQLHFFGGNLCVPPLVTEVTISP